MDTEKDTKEVKGDTSFKLIGVISGGQTGADRAGLDAAMKLGIRTGGFCPKGRKAEDGVIPPIYPMRETSSSDYPPRTRKNVADADVTILFYYDIYDGGTKLTREICEELGKPCLELAIASSWKPSYTAKLIKKLILQQVKRDFIINIAGPRESRCPGLQKMSDPWLTSLFEILK